MYLLAPDGTVVEVATTTVNINDNVISALGSGDSCGGGVSASAMTVTITNTTTGPPPFTTLVLAPKVTMTTGLTPVASGSPLNISAWPSPGGGGMTPKTVITSN